MLCLIKGGSEPNYLPDFERESSNIYNLNSKSYFIRKKKVNNSNIYLIL